MKEGSRSATVFPENEDSIRIRKSSIQIRSVIRNRKNQSDHSYKSEFSQSLSNN